MVGQLRNDQDSHVPPGEGGATGEITVVIDTACGAHMVGPTGAAGLLTNSRPSTFLGRAANGDTIHGTFAGDLSLRMLGGTKSAHTVDLFDGVSHFLCGLSKWADDDGVRTFLSRRMSVMWNGDGVPARLRRLPNGCLTDRPMRSVFLEIRSPWTIAPVNSLHVILY